MWKFQPSQKANHVTKLRKGDRLVLLPSGEEARVRMAAKNSFLVEGHILALQYRDEYDPKDNPSGKWCKLANKHGWNTGP
jgi:hypothetical protein